MTSPWWIFIPHPPQYSSHSGLAYASLLAKRAQLLAIILLVPGWLLVIVGAVLAVCAALLGSSMQPTSAVTSFGAAIEALSHHPGLISSIGAIVLAGIGWQWIDRARAASRVASVATTAIRTATSEALTDSHNPSPDRAAYDACIDAKVAWLESRMSIERLEGIVSALQQSISVNKHSGDGN